MWRKVTRVKVRREKAAELAARRGEGKNERGAGEAVMVVAVTSF